jgi:hypothetical protein
MTGNGWWMEQLIKWEFPGETEVLAEKSPQRHFVHHKSQIIWLGIERWLSRWGIGDWLPKAWQGPNRHFLRIRLSFLLSKKRVMGTQKMRVHYTWLFDKIEEPEKHGKSCSRRQVKGYILRQESLQQKLHFSNSCYQIAVSMPCITWSYCRTYVTSSRAVIAMLRGGLGPPMTYRSYQILYKAPNWPKTLIRELQTHVRQQYDISYFLS